MLFNSIQFFIFFFIIYSLYICLDHKKQNILLLIGSYIFYGAWNWKFLSLLFISTTIDYFCGLRISESVSKKTRKKFLFISIFSNLLILGFFKYFNFFSGNLQALFNTFGLHVPEFYLNVILPVGISFYTFQSMSYTIDIYYKKLQPAKNFLDFALFVAFFPQLVAGPIERARNLLPQICRPRKLSLDKFYEGCFLIFWGLFQKVVIADNLAKYVDYVFAWHGGLQSLTVLLSLYAFAFQIFCDFAGYSNIARGVGKCLGFEIMINFKSPYLAKNPREFWQRWHISLSTWLRDYLYIPLGGNKKGDLITYRNLFITMLLGGLWHGVAWNFIFWGLYQCLLLIVHRMLTPLFAIFQFNKNKFLERIITTLKIVCFFHITCYGWLIFRAQSLDQIIKMTRALFFAGTHISLFDFFNLVLQVIPCIVVLLLVQIVEYFNHDRFVIYRLNIFIRVIFYFGCILLFITYGVTGAKEFIYFQF